MNGFEVRGVRWFNFTTRDLTIMAVLIAATGAFQAMWAHFAFQMGGLGPFTSMFASFGFNIAGFVVLYLVPKPGAATFVKFFAAIVEVLLGNPFGPIAIFYGTVEGLGIDIAFAAMGQKLTLPMMVTGSLLAWAFAAPVDAYRDAVPMTIEGLTAYFGPGMAGKVFVSWLCFLAIEGLRRAGVKPLSTPAVIEANATSD